MSADRSPELAETVLGGAWFVDLDRRRRGDLPETATAVAVRLGPGDGVEVCAARAGRLLDGVWHRNPLRISVHLFRARLARHDPARRWPGARVIAA